MTPAQRKKLRSVFGGMRSRCYRVSDLAFDSYGGRGIKICKRWLGSFESFCRDMGPCPPGYSIERKKTNGGYSPSNCCWIPRHQQGQNKRNSVRVRLNGKLVSLSELTSRLKLHHATVVGRIRSGWSVERAIETPTKPPVKPKKGVYRAGVFSKRTWIILDRIARAFSIPFYRAADKVVDEYFQKVRKYVARIEKSRANWN